MMCDDVTLCRDASVAPLGSRDTHTHTHTHTQTHTNTHTHTHTHIIYMYIYIHIYVNIYTYIHTHTHTHTNNHTHTHTGSLTKKARAIPAAGLNALDVVAVAHALSRYVATGATTDELIEDPPPHTTTDGLIEHIAMRRRIHTDELIEHIADAALRSRKGGGGACGA